MNSIVFSPMERKELHNHGVEALILFGSQAQGNARETSDYDIGVIGKSANNVYDFIYSLLSEKINKLVTIDIVFLLEAPMELQSHVAKYGIVLYRHSPSTFADFRERVMTTYADFAPLRHLFQKATMERISS